LYPHAYRDHWVAQQYLPTHLQGKVFYEPGELGYEQHIRQQVIRRREAQLAAMIEIDSHAPGEILTFRPATRAEDRWLQRTVSQVGTHLGGMRDRILDAAALQRHSLVLDLNAGTGLLTWEALRRVPEGGVWALSSEAQAAAALQQHAERLPEVERPIVLVGEITHLPALLQTRGEHTVRFDAVVGRNVLTRYHDKAAVLASIRPLLQPGGCLSLAEVVPRRAQRLSALVELTELGPELAARLRAAEEAMYHTPDDPLVHWDLPELEAAVLATGFALHAPLRHEIQEAERHITAAHLTHWFTVSADGRRRSYARHLLTHLSAPELQQVERCFRRQLLGQTVHWHTAVVYLTGSSQ
jgi:putative ATPase